MRKKSGILTEQELEIMKVVWETEAATVREVYEALRARRQIAYTTVMTMMNILEEKGHLAKERGERAFVYRTTRPKQGVVAEMVREFVDRVFNGSAEPLLMHLVREQKISEKELAKIAKMARESEK
jgi:predicted transcriptional regulator